MNSEINGEDTKRFICTLSESEFNETVNLALAFSNAMKTGSGIKEPYNILLGFLEEKSKEKDISFIYSPDGSYINALSQFSSVFEKLHTPPEVRTIKATSLKEINESLSQHNCIFYFGTKRNITINI